MTSLVENVFVSVLSDLKPRYYSSLDQFLKALAQGLLHSHYRPVTPRYRLYFAEGEQEGWSPAHVAQLRSAIDEVLTWPLPGSTAAAKAGLPWADGDNQSYAAGSAASRKAFVTEARNHIVGAVQI